MVLPPNKVKKIAIFRALQIGDMLCSIPAVRALRASFPEAEITLIGLPWAEALVSRFHHYFDRFLSFPGFPGLPEQIFKAPAFSAFLKNVLNQEFDLVLQMQGNGSLVNPLVELFGAKNTAGYYKEGTYVPNKCLFMEYPENGHEIRRHLKLMEFLGIPSQGEDLEFPLTDQDFEDFERSSLPIEEGNYICIHPGSRGLSRQWDPGYFAILADAAAEKGLIPVITGTKEELDIVNKLASKMKNEAVIAAGKTSMGAVSVLIKRARALVSNCTGVSHISAALKTPSVVVSLDGEPERWVPLNTNIHRSIDWTRTPDFDKVYSELQKVLELRV